MVKVIPLFKNDANLIQKAARGNRQAQRKLYEHYSPRMLSVCRQYIRDLQHAEDVMIKGFYKVFTKMGGFRGEGSFEGWVRKIMVRESISFLRQHENLVLQEDNIAEVPEEVVNTIDSGMDVAHIQEMIDELPEGYKAVFVLYAIEGYKHSEIAEMLSISEGTSKSQLFKARKMLQAKLNTIKETGYGTN